MRVATTASGHKCKQVNSIMVKAFAAATSGVVIESKCIHASSSRPTCTERSSPHRHDDQALAGGGNRLDGFGPEVRQLAALLVERQQQRDHGLTDVVLRHVPTGARTECRRGRSAEEARLAFTWHHLCTGSYVTPAHCWMQVAMQADSLAYVLLVRHCKEAAGEHYPTQSVISRHSRLQVQRVPLEVAAPGELQRHRRLPAHVQG